MVNKMRKFNFKVFSVTAPDIWSDVSIFFEKDEFDNKPIVISPNDDTFMDFLLINEPEKERHELEFLYRELILIGRKQGYQMRRPSNEIKLIGKYTICGGTYYEEDFYHRYWFLSNRFNILKISFHSEVKYESFYNRISEDIVKSIEIR